MNAKVTKLTKYSKTYIYIYIQMSVDPFQVVTFCGHIGLLVLLVI